MKANELMLGDWVRRRWTCCNTGREVIKDFQVTEIRKNGETLYAWGKGGNMGRVEDLEPIPITPEILEKNGFVFFDDSYNKKPIRRYKYEGDEYKYGISTDDTDGSYFTFGIPYNGICFNIVRALRVHSIHELQHALRLCGIDLDIVI